MSICPANSQFQVRSRSIRFQNLGKFLARFLGPSRSPAVSLTKILTPNFLCCRKVSDSTSDRVIVLRDENGSLQKVTEIPTLADPQSFLVADLNQDGYSDLAITSFEGRVEILLNNKQGGFGQSVSLILPSPSGALAAADLDGDGDIDLAILNQFSDSVSALANRGDGTFVVGETFAAGPGPSAISVFDFDGDSLNDLVVANLGSGNDDGGITVLRNRSISGGNITFDVRDMKVVVPPCPECMPGDRTPIVDVVADRFFDTNADGRVDHLDVPSIACLAIGGPLYVLDGESLGTLQVVGLFDNRDSGLSVLDGASSITKGDFDHDGDLDLAVASTLESGVILILNQSETHFTVIGRTRSFGGAFGFTPVSVLASLDVDLDGDLDFVVSDQDTPCGIFVPSRCSSVTLFRSSLGPDPSPEDNCFVDPIDGDYCIGVKVTLTEAHPSESLAIASEAKSVIVNSAGDGGDANLTDGKAMAADGTVTLRRNRTSQCIA